MPTWGCSQMGVWADACNVLKSVRQNEEPSFLIKAFRAQAHFRQLPFPGESGNCGALIPVESSLAFSPMQAWIQLFLMPSLEHCPEGRGRREGWWGLGEFTFGHMLKFLTPGGVVVTAQGSLAENWRPKDKDKESRGRKEKGAGISQFLRTWVLESSCLGSTSGVFLFFLFCCPGKVID